MNAAEALLQCALEETAGQDLTSCEVLVLTVLEKEAGIHLGALASKIKGSTINTARKLPGAAKFVGGALVKNPRAAIPAVGAAAASGAIHVGARGARAAANNAHKISQRILEFSGSRVSRAADKLGRINRA
jgi:hypothetical protein